MKKQIKFIAAAVAVALCSAFAFTGCADNGKTDGDANGNSVETVDYAVFTPCVIFTASSDVTEITAETYVEDYMDALKAAGKLDYEGTTGLYGFFVTSVNGAEAEGNGYWSLLTTDADYQTDDDYTYTYTFKSLVLKSSSLGVSSLPVVEGESYAWIYLTY